MGRKARRRVKGNKGREGVERELLPEQHLFWQFPESLTDAIVEHSAVTEHWTVSFPVCHKSTSTHHGDRKDGV